MNSFGSAVGRQSCHGRMTTHLNLDATEIGNFRGSCSANISGEGLPG